MNSKKLIPLQPDSRRTSPVEWLRGVVRCKTLAEGTGFSVNMGRLRKEIWEVVDCLRPDLFQMASTPGTCTLLRLRKKLPPARIQTGMLWSLLVSDEKRLCSAHQSACCWKKFTAKRSDQTSQKSARNRFPAIVWLRLSRLANQGVGS